MLNVAESFLARLLWPARCVGCGTAADESRAFCELCAEAVVPLERACPACALPGAGAGVRCGPCHARPFPFRAARAAFVYGGAIADAIVRFKHGHLLAPARPLGRCLAPVLTAAVAEGVDCLVPVPLHPRRLRARGFNQAAELVAAARAAWSPSARPPEMQTELLVRLRDTPPLGHEAPLSRRLRVAGAFAVTRPAAVKGRRVLVVDDVMTTGATLAECARAFLDAGAADVQVAALARAL